MKRLISKTAARYAASGEMEKLIGYLVTRSSGLRLEKQHFDDIIEHFNENGGSLKGIQGKEKEDKGFYYEKLHNSIDKILKKHKLKNKN
ncbi:gp13 [Bacillus phage G]|uniref:Gp13 n=1 Tax=Bacillus phage G TaxID=2884420 RepID=G3MB83_9CAUD|nr:gp13 [Bacillus phage G]AEO93284.1 gp13 [Bacillus phage G]